MKLIIAGSRTVFASPEEIQGLVEHYNIKPTEIVSGTAAGMDRCGEAYVKAANLKLAKFPADWDKFGKSAGHKRNAQMAEYADALLLIWDGQSKGSAGMGNIMRIKGKPVFEVTVEPEPKVFNGEIKQLPAGPHKHKLMFSNGHFQPKKSQEGQSPNSMETKVLNKIGKS